jgi:rod shape-determining protein MreD
MKIGKIIALFIIVLPIHVFLSHFTGLGYAYFDLLLILTLYFSMQIELIPLIYLSFAIGLIKDLLSGPIIGLSGFSFPVVALISALAFSRLQIKRFYTQFFLIFILSIINLLTDSFISLIFGIRIINLHFLEYLYMGLGNGIIFTIILNIRKIIPRRFARRGRKYAA